jgi:hypothetical protein
MSCTCAQDSFLPSPGIAPVLQGTNPVPQVQNIHDKTIKTTQQQNLIQTTTISSLVTTSSAILCRAQLTEIRLKE